MKQIVKSSIVALTMAAVSGTASAAGELNLYNWGNYTNPELITKFEKEFDVKVTITDEKGKKIRSLTGSNRPGLNRVIWDLQDDPKQRLQGFGGGGQTQFVPPGEYTVSLSMGEAKAKGSVTVLPSPIADAD